LIDASELQEERILKLIRVYIGFTCRYGIFHLLSKMFEACGLVGMEFLRNSEHHAYNLPEHIQKLPQKCYAFEVKIC
jgi:hypothetical protein